jgi:hypothetical protein
MISWDATVHRLGYTSEADMWHDLYVHRGLSISVLAERLDVSRNTIRTSLERRHIPIRKQGGPNNQKLEVTDALVDEVQREGIAAVAKRLNLAYTTLYKRLHARKVLEAARLLPEDAARIATIGVMPQDEEEE